VPDAVWQSCLRELLRRSGVLVERSGDFVFVHQTFGEYLAAQYIAADPRRAAAARHELLGVWRRHYLIGQRLWLKPDWEDSFTSFLVAACKERPGWTRALRRLASGGRFDGCTYIATLAVDGALWDSSAAKVAADYLAKLSTSQSETYDRRVVACEGVAALGDARGRAQLTAMAEGRPNSPWMRTTAAQSLARLGDPRGSELLAAMCADRGNPNLRFRAALLLTGLGDSRGTSALAAIAADSSVDGLNRPEAAVALAALGDPAGEEQLRMLAMDAQLTSAVRQFAAERLIRIGSLRHLETLAALVCDASLAETTGVWAGFWLIEQTRPGDADLLARVGEVPTARTRVGVELMTRLSELGDSRGRDGLASLAADGSVRVSARLSASELLADLGDLRSVTPLLDLSMNSRSPNVRVSAANKLARIGDPRGAEVLATIASDHRSGLDDLRRTAARALADSGDIRGLEILTELATGHLADDGSDVSQPQRSRRGRSDLRLRSVRRERETGLQQRALGELSGLADPRALEILQRTATEASATTEQRRRAARVRDELIESWTLLAAAPLSDYMTSRLRRTAVEMATAGDALGRRLLALMAWNGPASSRREAADALARLGDERATEMLADMVKNTTLPVRDRCDAALALVRLGDARGADLLTAVAEDAEAPAVDRCAAAEALAILGDARARELLAALAADALVDSATRSQAGELLAQQRDQRDNGMLAELAADTAIEPATRLALAEELTERGDPRGADALERMAADPALDEFARRWASGMLEQYRNGR
jgi:HEAT repeat protein